MLTCSLSVFLHGSHGDGHYCHLVKSVWSENEMVQHILNLALLQKQHPVFDDFSSFFPSVVVFLILVFPDESPGVRFSSFLCSKLFGLWWSMVRVTVAEKNIISVHTHN